MAYSHKRLRDHLAVIMKLKKIFFLSLAVLGPGLLATSCDDHFFENEGDCDVHHYVRFVYDMNLKWADAFPSEVKSVNLYVFDRNNIFVKEYKGEGEELSKPGYQIELDLPEGNYSLLAWCGLKNEGASEESFTVPVPRPGVTTLQEMTATMATQNVGIYNDTPGVYSKKELYFLYWGYTEATLVDNHDGMEYYHDISLIKDTNHVRIILQELSGEDMNPDDYEFSIEDANGVIGWNNNLIGNQVVTYQPWNQFDDEVGVGKIDATDGTLTYVKGVVADLSTSRLMASMSGSVMLTISNHTSGDLIARVPIIQYALLSKKYYESSYHHVMTDQEFLDREDEYVMTFFLVNGSWMNAYIDIQQWRIVLHDYGLGN